MNRAVVALLLAAAGSACGRQTMAPPPPRPAPVAAWTAGWSRDAVCYEVFVRSFQDSDGDGIGDLKGLRSRLDYINDGNPGSGEDLGATCIWLMPVTASPSYHGYDVTDYYTVEPDYGTNEDLKGLIAEAHARGIRVIVDLVLNHVSSQHPWFQEALRDPASPHRDWFRWSARDPGVKNRWGGNNWHRSPIRDEYYYGFFWSGMPDLDYQNTAVREEAKRVAGYWLKEMGVDGFRLDAVSFLVEEGLDRIQHTAGTHAVLRELAADVRRTSPNAFTIGEVWDNTAALVSYYPDQLDAYFAFEISDAIIASVGSASAAELLQAIVRTNASLPDQRWAPFLRNHDQVRTRTAVGGSLARARIAATILLTLPGTPFVYYGEEIGMSGGKDGVPEGDIGVRTPMQWSADANGGFTSGSPWYLPRADWRTVNVSAQSSDSASLLSHYRRLIHLRTTTPMLASGEWIPVAASDPAVAAYIRRAEGRAVLVVMNLGERPLTLVSLSSSASVLAPGAYQPTALVGDPPATLVIPGNGRLESYVPFEVLEPLSSHLLELRGI